MYNNKLITSPKTMANIANNYFTSKIEAIHYSFTS